MINNLEKIIIPSPSVISKKTLTIKELQSILGLGYQKTMELVHRDDFPKIVVGRRILIIRSKLDEWIDNNIGLSI
jgi:excisionase family DNA binding protein